MLIQRASIDVAMWTPDAEYHVFPQGARPKGAAYAPSPVTDPVLVGGKRYLFKLSRKTYPDQFWAEVVAYRVGSLLGLEIPPAFAAWNSAIETCGALIEWFYEDGVERLVLAGDFLQKVRPDFERARGSSHSLSDNEALLRTMTQQGTLAGDWRQWWVEALAFDSLIGNTDRHQDNWGFLFSQSMPSLNKCWLAPLFDNGTSLGFELQTSRVAEWDEARIDKYVDRGTHHVRWPTHGGTIQRGHLVLLARALEHWPATREPLRRRFSALSQAAIENSLCDLPHYILPVPMTKARLSLTLRLLRCRLKRILDIL